MEEESAIGLGEEASVNALLRNILIYKNENGNRVSEIGWTI
jgi:hypothetical protein